MNFSVLFTDKYAEERDGFGHVERKVSQVLREIAGLLELLSSVRKTLLSRV
jgi:hypothetical protein